MATDWNQARRCGGVAVAFPLLLWRWFNGGLLVAAAASHSQRGGAVSGVLAARTVVETLLVMVHGAAMEDLFEGGAAMAAEAAAMVVREEEELAVAVNLKVDSRLVQVRWNATVTGGSACVEDALWIGGGRRD